MRRTLRIATVVWLAALLLQLNVTSQTGITSANFVNFEGAQTNPIRLSADGTRLFAVNTPDARLSVFDLAAAPTAPVLLAEVPVGIEPVSVNPRTNTEAWVVNQVSDSISIVDVEKGIVVDTLSVKDEPADVVFAGFERGLAFVSVSRSNEVRVFDAVTRTEIRRIPLEGENPRALAVSPDGSRVYVAFALSGNKTTIVPTDAAPAQPAPTNPQLPDAPRVSLIVQADDPAWAPGTIQYTMPDNDVAEIDTATGTVSRYFSGVGTVNLGVAVHPVSGDLYVTNTDARNLVRFEPALRGRIVDNRVTRISSLSGASAAMDLNAGLDYAVLPNEEAKVSALAQPTAIVSDTLGGGFYVAAFGSDRVARVADDGSVLARIDVAKDGSSARTMRGPRGLALNAKANLLYVLNRMSNTIAIVDTVNNAVAAEMPVGSFDPTPAAIRQGRGFLYDARLSGNGTAACAACHVDADMDLLAWDLGNPGGVMERAGGESMHPMKGPMTTQTLRGLRTLEPFHWRGDRADFLAFKGAFDSLMGGSVLPDADMIAYRDFVETLRFQPNPNRNLDGSLRASVAGGDPAAGRNTFINEPFVANVTCNSCHTAATEGTNRTIFSAATLQETQPFKVPHLRNLYQKTGMNKAAGARSVGGFGYLHDGSIGSLFEFLSLPVFQNIANDSVRKRNIAAFLLSFDTGTPPAVGHSRTVTAKNLDAIDVAGEWTTLERGAAASANDVVVKGTIDGERRGFVYRPTTNDYRSDRTGVGPFTRAQLRAKVTNGDTLTFMGVPAGSGTRMGIDRDLDGVLDGDVGQPVPEPEPEPLPEPTPEPLPAPLSHVHDVATTTASGTATTFFQRRDTVVWRVTIVNQTGVPVAGASVPTTLTIGSSRVASLTATTGADGVAVFSRRTHGDMPGTYTITVGNVVSAAAKYDPAANVESSTQYQLRK
jgi:YVTN family beta-propeller protein